MIVTTTMLATLCLVRKYQLVGPNQGRTGLLRIRSVASQLLRLPASGWPPIVPTSDGGTDMLALVTAAHGQSPSHILIILAAVAAAIFWRGLIKLGLAFIVIIFVLLLITSVSDLFHGISMITSLFVR